MIRVLRFWQGKREVVLYETGSKKEKKRQKGRKY